MKKIVCTFLVVLIMLSLLLFFEMGILAESGYDELWAKKMEYEKICMLPPALLKICRTYFTK